MSAIIQVPGQHFHRAYPGSLQIKRLAFAHGSGRLVPLIRIIQRHHEKRLANLALALFVSAMMHPP